MKISIVIPALNEENYLQKLLQSIKQQTFKDYEVIVADAGSTDNTVNIARRYGAKVVKGGMPAIGRNRGAEAAKGDFIFFIDSDVKLPKRFLEKAYNEVQERYLELATCEFRPLSNLLIDKVMHDFANMYIKLSQFSNQHAGGFCIIVTKRLFERVKGFDESIKLAEDHEFIKRASKYRPLRVLNSTEIKMSVRRLDKEGRLKLIKKYMHSELYRLFKGELKEDVIEYEFGNFDKKQESKLEKNLIKIEKQLIKMNKNYKRFTKKYFKSGKLTVNLKKNLDRFRNQFNSMGDSFIDSIIKGEYRKNLKSKTIKYLKKGNRK
ncbi:MAG: glycosyltransferase [Nanoarchaeota archaeon]|nr:glycosyltransferase [Nanoarchaeota archaeon]